FEFCTNSAEDIFGNDAINTVFIATRHDTHADYVKQALQAGKNTFVEKPLCLNFEELEEIKDLYETLSRELTVHAPILMVGYNRRFSPLIAEVKKIFRTGPLASIYRVNCGMIPPDSWFQDVEVGGGRIIGEVCHFIDTLTYITGSQPISIYASAMKDPNHFNDTVNISLTHRDGSISTISYFANGEKSLPKEKLEIYGHGCVAILDDFKKLTIHAQGKKKVKKLASQDKGQKEEITQFIDSIVKGKGEVIPFNELFNTSLVTFKIIESIQTGQSILL
ncbi:MAG: Gfo/Idh/MocA family oxidoreductase, partial [Deltaproteobacteria bacterium]|nr:Gfo/Idh/MocA family oxidoreductase [Deltaproteobacteria bacterium]